MELLRKIFLAKEEKYGEGENTRNFFMKRNIQNLIGNWFMAAGFFITHSLSEGRMMDKKF